MAENSHSCSSGAVIGVGNVLAFIISWKLWHDLAWAIAAALFGWVYVAYAAIYYIDQIKGWLG